MSETLEASPLWPATLDHIRYDSPDPARLADFYSRADHFASLEIPIWWGPGRHGAGNNLFFMIKDPDGNNIEISAELETMKKGQPGRTWMGARHAINLWGEPWIRDTGAPAQP